MTPINDTHVILFRVVPSPMNCEAIGEGKGREGEGRGGEAMGRFLSYMRIFLHSVVFSDVRYRGSVTQFIAVGHIAKCDGLCCGCY